MQVTGVGWVGTKTEETEKLVDFYENVLGLEINTRGGDFSAYKLPDECIVSVLGATEGRAHFTTGPVIGFSVVGLPAAVEELKAAGIELLGTGGATFQHFRAPDGNVYELFEDGWGVPK